jgi:hypothetical protein
MFNLQGKDSDKYFKEVEDKLIEETNYLLELNQSQEVVKACEKIENLLLTDYYNKEAEIFVTVRLSGFRYTISGEIGLTQIDASNPNKLEQMFTGKCEKVNERKF